VRGRMLGEDFRMRRARSGFVETMGGCFYLERGLLCKMAFVHENDEQ